MQPLQRPLDHLDRTQTSPSHLVHSFEDPTIGDSPYRAVQELITAVGFGRLQGFEEDAVTLVPVFVLHRQLTRDPTNTHTHV